MGAAMGRWGVAVSGAILLGLLGAGFWWWLQGGQRAAPLRIACLHLSPVDQATYNGFRDGLAELGYREGERVVFRYAGAVGDIARLDAVAAELVADRPDLVFVSSTPATLAVQRATLESRIPVVFAPVNDPVGAGIVQSLQHPGGNITGIKLPAGDDLRLGWLTRIAPRAKRVLAPYNPQDKSALATLANIQPVAPGLGIELLARPVTDVREIDALLADLPERVQAIFLPRDSTVEGRIADFVAVARQRRLPISAPSLTQVEAGALFSYGFVHRQIGRQAARLAEQVLRGIPPADLPVEVAENFLAINMATAEVIGLSIPDQILLQAEQIIRN